MSRLYIPCMCCHENWDSEMMRTQEGPEGVKYQLCPHCVSHNALWWIAYDRLREDRDRLVKENETLLESVKAERELHRQTIRMHEGA